jgi:hypothetical protein
VKVLFVGDGKHDVGPKEFGDFQPRPANGVVPTLARRIVPAISGTSISLTWQEVALFDPRAKHGYDHKVNAAAKFAQKLFDCEALVCVADGDGDAEQRRDALIRGAQSQAIPVATGVAVQSIEAWTLGAVDALAAELALSVSQLRRVLPKKPVEDLHQRSENEELRPKSILQKICALANREPHTLLRAAIAERAHIESLAAACPRGFAPFVEDLRRAFVSAI